MQIRPVPASDMERAMYLGAQAFRGGQREPYVPDPNPPWRDLYGIYDENGLQAKVAVNPYEVHLGPEVVVPMGGIASVACLPACRGRGYVAAGLDYALERMREKGQAVSFLFPFSFDFYRRHGWEWVGRKRVYTVPTRILKSDPGTEKVRAATAGDREAIVAVYTRFAHRYRGMHRRSESEWSRILDDASDRYTYTYLYEQDGQIEGYLTYRGGKSEETWLRDFICVTPRAQRALLGLLRRHEMQVEKFCWSAPCDDRLWSLYYDWDFETKIEPATQARMVDLVGALQAWRPAIDARGKVDISVSDEHAPWNTGAWRVEFDAGRVSVSATKSEPQVTLDIMALSQAYFGAPDLDEVRQADRLTVHDEAGYAALRALLAGPPMWTNDEF